MSTLLEIAAAYEAIREPDQLDQAAAIAQLEREHGVSAIRAKLMGEGRPDCLDCGYAIPQERRDAVQNAVRCKPCQDDHDKREVRRHG
jgi:RNA polymerase-binding transcription factor DksA